jgi:hypothetical protein
MVPGMKRMMFSIYGPPVFWRLVSLHSAGFDSAAALDIT